jgi:hypothetical protein
VITVAGDARGVVGLVYVAAFVLAEGESCVDVARGFPATLLLDALQPPEFRDDLGIPGVDLYLRRDAYAAVIGADLPRPTTEVMAATQRPVSSGRARREGSGETLAIRTIVVLGSDRRSGDPPRRTTIHGAPGQRGDC